MAGQGARGANTHQTHEMTVPNEIIGCVIGKGGSKIAEIRWDRQEHSSLLGSLKHFTNDVADKENPTWTFL